MPKSKKRKPTDAKRLATAPAENDTAPGSTVLLDSKRLRACLLAEPAGAADYAPVDTSRMLTPAAVLVPLVRREHGIDVLFTQRTDQLKDHPGQISFPGGRVEASDGTPAETALREAWEEIGLAASAIEVVGYLPPHATGTGFLITPVVALVTPPFDVLPHPEEVARVFEVPLSFLMDRSNHLPHSWGDRGRLRHALALRYGDDFIWGATAAIVISLFRALGCASEPA